MVAERFPDIISGRLKHTLRCYHEAFQTIPHGVTVLDYGAGPVIMSTISAATKASEIVLSDYTDSNRIALRQWLDGERAAFDWSPKSWRAKTRTK